MYTLSSARPVVVRVLPLPCLSLELPYFPAVSAGFPSPADDYQEERLSLDQHLIRHPSATFFVRVVGRSMVGAGIYPDDILVVDRSLEAKPNDVIVAVLEREFTVERFVCRDGHYFLQAANPDYPDIPLPPETDFQVWGVVTAVIHKPYLL